MPKEVFENDYKDYISNTKDTVNVTLATDDDKQLGPRSPCVHACESGHSILIPLLS